MNIIEIEKKEDAQLSKESSKMKDKSLPPLDYDKEDQIENEQK